MIEVSLKKYQQLSIYNRDEKVSGFPKKGVSGVVKNKQSKTLDTVCGI